MEVLVSQPRSQYRSRIRSRSSLSSCLVPPPPGSFVGTSCRAWHSGAGILPSPPLFARSAPSLTSPRSEPPKRSRKRNITVTATRPVCEVNTCSDDHPCYELWAGPAYSNSPPPSSLPMPKFCSSGKRAATLESSDYGSDLDVLPGAKSAPTTPRCQSLSVAAGSSFVNALATATLRRVLNLDPDFTGE